MLGAAVGGEVHRIAVPHGESIRIVGVGNRLFEDVVLQVVDVNVLRDPAGVALPGAEVAEDAVIGDLGAVGVE